MRSVRLLLWIALLEGVLAQASTARDALYGVVSRGVSAVAVGDSGRVLYAWPAPHNQAWFAADPYLVDRYRAVTTGANNYILVGHRGHVMRSFDAEGYGSRWIPEGSRTTQDLFGVTHAGDRLVAVGASGTVIHKPTQSAGDWLLVASDQVPTGQTLRAVAANISFTAAVGDSGTILWSLSANLTSWTRATTVPTTADLCGIALGPGAAPGRFWAVGQDGTILRSFPSAQVWETLASPVSARLNGVAFSPLTQSGYIGVAVGDGGTILYSNGGDLWTQVDSRTTENLYGVAYTGSGAGGGFVAVGEANVILWSQYGTIWNDVIVPVQSTSWGTIRGAFRGGRQER